MPLKEEFEKLKKYPNGEQIGIRIIQLHDFALDPENDYLRGSVENVLDAIGGYEERLMQRSRLQIVHEGRLLHNLRKAMYGSSDEEWLQFKQEINLQPLEGRYTALMLMNVDGLIKMSLFEEWILGKEQQPINPETIVDTAMLIGLLGRKEIENRK